MREMGSLAAVRNGRYLLEGLGQAFCLSIALRALGWREGKGQEMAGQLTTDS